MGKLVYSMITSLDGYATSEADLGFDPANEEVHSFIEARFRGVGTNLYGRRMYETMVFWETAHELPDAPPYIVDYARTWQATDKIVYSTTLESPSSERTRIERSFDADAVRKLKEESERDLSISGPEIAAEAIRAGLVDEYHLILTTQVIGSGTRFFPDDVSLDLQLVEHRSFASGILYAQYRAR